MKINKEKYSLNVWIGLAKVKITNNNNILNANNAYVNILGLANSKGNFKRKAKLACFEIELNLLRIEDVETLNNRVRKFKVDQEILKIANDLLKSNNRIKFSTFHTYD